MLVIIGAPDVVSGKPLQITDERGNKDVLA
jgi:hypothetical protein